MNNIFNKEQSPIQQFVIYNQFPLLYIYHLIMLFLIINVSLNRNYYDLSRNQSQLNLFSKIIVDKEWNDNKVAILTLNDFKKQLEFVNCFKNIDKHSFGQVNTNKTNYIMKVEYFEPFDADGNQKQYYFNLTNLTQITQPFDQNDDKSIRTFIQEINQFKISIKDVEIKINDYYLTWNIFVYYYPTDLNQININLRYNYDIIDFENENEFVFIEREKDFIFYFGILIFSLLCLAQTFIEAYDDQQLSSEYISNYSHNKLLYKMLKKQKSWDQLSLKYRNLFLNNFFTINLIGNFLQISIGVLGITGNTENDLFQTCLGIGGFISVLVMVNYLQQNKNIQNVNKILKKSMPKIFRILLGFCPVFIAFSYLCTCLFWRLNYFSNVKESLLTLLALMLGDQILDIAILMVQENQFGAVVLISFQITFIIGVHNVLISIVCSKTQKIQDKHQIINNQDEIQRLNQEVKDSFKRKVDRLTQVIEYLQEHHKKFTSINKIRGNQFVIFRSMQIQNLHKLLQKVQQKKNEQRM